MLDRRERERAILRALVKKQHVELKCLQARNKQLEDQMRSLEPMYMEDL